MNIRHTRYLSWLVGAVLLGGLLYFAGPSAWSQLQQAEWTYLLPALALTAFIQLLAAARWHFLLGQMAGSSAPSFAHVLHHTLTGAAVGLFTPSRDLGEMGTRIASVQVSHRLGLSRVAASVLLDRLFDVLVVIPFALAGLPFLLGGWRHPWLLGICYLMAVGLTATLLSNGQGYRSLLRRLSTGYGWLFARWHRLPLLRRWQPAGPESLAGLGRDVSPSLLVGAFGLTVIKYSSFALRAFLVAKAVGAAIPLTSVLLALPLAQASLLLAVTPGGVGVAEMGWLGALSLLGVAGAASAAFVVAHRLFQTVFVLLVALMGQAAYAAASARRAPVVERISRQ